MVVANKPLICVNTNQVVCLKVYADRSTGVLVHIAALDASDSLDSNHLPTTQSTALTITEDDMANNAIYPSDKSNRKRPQSASIWQLLGG